MPNKQKGTDKSRSFSNFSGTSPGLTENHIFILRFQIHFVVIFRRYMYTGTRNLAAVVLRTAVGKERDP